MNKISIRKNKSKLINSAIENVHSTAYAMKVPNTTSKFIGLRSTDFNCQLEKYGPYTRGKMTISKSLGWPNEAI